MEISYPRLNQFADQILQKTMRLYYEYKTTFNKRNPGCDINFVDYFCQRDMRGTPRVNKSLIFEISYNRKENTINLDHLFETYITDYETDKNIINIEKYINVDIGILDEIYKTAPEAVENIVLSYYKDEIRCALIKYFENYDYWHSVYAKNLEEMKKDIDDLIKKYESKEMLLETFLYFKWILNVDIINKAKNLEYNAYTKEKLQIDMEED